MQDNGNRKRKPASGSKNSKNDLDRVLQLSVENLLPSPENDVLYKPVDPDDQAILELSKSIKERGILEPIRITEDGYIVSGHRRFCAAKVAGLVQVPCIILPIKRDDDIDAFTRLLREHNRQRDKTLDEKLREEIVSTSPEDSMAELWAYRRAKSAVSVSSISLGEKKTRSKISKAKKPFLEACLKIIEAQKKYWPLSDRRIHYPLLNDPPLIHASKPASRYANNAKSYRALTELLTRARLEGLIPFEAIADETRPVSIWNIHNNPRSFVREQIEDYLRGYYRNLMQSQPNHIEIIGEKNTIAGTIRPIAGEYTIPLTTGRGYCSLPPRQAMAERFRLSGKDKLVLLFVSDFDPEGEDIAHSFARSLRDDFEIEEIHPIKVALTAEQVEEYQLPVDMIAKKGSSRRDKFVEKHGENVWELEALEPDVLQLILRQVIESVIDRDAYSAEIEAERKDAHFLNTVRQRVLAAMRDVDMGDGQ